MGCIYKRFHSHLLIAERKKPDNHSFVYCRKYLFIYSNFSLEYLDMLTILPAKVFRTRLVFTPRRWTFHERVNTDEHCARDNVRVVA